MRYAVDDKTYTVEEYVKHELNSECRHEFINGQLFEMPGEKDINNKMGFIIAMILYNVLKNMGYDIYNHDVKVAIPGGNKFYYPDVFATKEERNENNQYIKYDPEIIVEIVSESSHVTDYVDKYIDYSKIPSLTYYIIAEPETILITVYEKDNNGKWIAHKYTSIEDTVNLEKFNVKFQLKEIYQL